MDKRNNLKSKLAPFLVFVISLTGSFLLYKYAQKNVNNEEQGQFSTFSTSVNGLIKNRAEIYINSLYGAKGLFAASNNVQRDEWHAYVSTTDTIARYPGISLIAFVQKVTKENRNDFEKSVQKDTSIKPEGYPNFKIHPDVDKDVYYPYTYVEPALSPTSTALGFDLSSDPIRFEALNRAVKSGTAALSGSAVALTGTSAIFSVYEPIYRNGEKIDTEDQRQQALQGLVVATFVNQNFFTKVFSELNIPGPISINVTDDTNDSAGNGKKLFENHSVGEGKNILMSQTPITIAGRTWSINISAPADYSLSAFQRKTPYWVLTLALLLSSLISFQLYSLATSEKRAQNLAEKITGELKDSEEKYRTMFESLQDVLYRTDLEGRITLVSPSIEKYLGISASQLVGKSANDFYPDQKQRQEMIRKLMSNGTVSDFPVTLYGKNKTPIDVSVNARLLYDDKKSPIGIESLLRDITERKQAEDKLIERTQEFERFNKLMVDRELKMVELKKELNNLKNKNN
jgi:PAS domain S-box-containing protein